MPLLNAEGITSGYGELDILHNASVHVNAGEIVALIGPNGAGKSTLMKTIFGLLRAKAGRIIFNEEEITGLSPDRVVRKGICYVPQTENIFPSLTVEENLEMGAFIRQDDFRDRLEAVYQIFPDLKPRRKERAGRLSGGQRQMVAMGRALMLDPHLLLLDEPSAGLAPKLVELIFEKIQAINQAGVAILMVEQNAQQALKLSDRGYVLANGQNRFEGQGEALLHDKEVARLYLGG